MTTVIVIAAIGIALFFIGKSAIGGAQGAPKDENAEAISLSVAQTITAAKEEERITHPGKGYFYYNLVGMQYRGLVESDYGIHGGSAVSERGNKYDKFAVAIKNGAGKVVAYVTREENKRLYGVISERGGETRAVYRIWERGEKIYGCAYIKEEDE